VDDAPTAVGVVLAWAARIALVAAFVFIGATKFSNDPNGEWVQLFDKIGWGHWFRYFTGGVQVTGALLMLPPWTLTVGALMLGCTMIGAMITDIVVMHAPGYALLPLVLLGIITAIWFAGTYGSLGRNRR
jgi:putative oxidoreductase